MNIEGQSVLVTGGTGSFGRQFVQTLLTHHRPKRIIVFSRDELKQYEMKQQHGDNPVLRFFLGDVRDAERLYRAFQGVDCVVHAAALKQVPTLEYNPFEAIKTNIIGAQNIINAAIDQKVKRVVALSTDKAVNPCNLYGATKLCAEKLFVDANAYVGEGTTRFSIVRYGNVIGSRGSVIPLFLKQRETGQLTLTDKRMTRFWILMDQAIKLVLDAIDKTHGGEIFVPKIPSLKLVDLAKRIGPDCKLVETGIRPGEKLHEVLLTEEESRHAREINDKFIIQPEHDWWNLDHWKEGKAVADDFQYASDTNTEWLSSEALDTIINDVARQLHIKSAAPLV
jgi:UDP-N-acetylglucosamine 4,6-dehydratase